ncbi:MAG: sodium:calcium antiporter [Candidatus Thorarchaeota archaeon]
MNFNLFKKSRFTFYWIMIIFYLIYFRTSLDFSVSVLMIFLGLFIAIESSEIAVEAIDMLAKRLKLSTYVGGVISSIASNTPELVIAAFAVFAGKTEFAIALITIATGFNILMLGVLIILGNKIRRGPIDLPAEVIDVEVPIMRVAIVILGSIFTIGIVEFVIEVYNKVTENNASNVVPRLPHEASALMVLTYLVYLFFIVNHNLNQLRSGKEPVKPNSLSKQHPMSRYKLIGFLVLAFAGIFVAGEMISSSVEFLADKQGIDEFLIAFIVGFSASIPEHFIALLAANKDGGIELGLGNLMAGSMQNLLMVIGLTGLISGIAAWLGVHTADGVNSIDGLQLIHETAHGFIPFILVQIGFAWLILFLVKSSITDDKKLDYYEGFTIVMAQSFVFIIFLKGILGL